MNNIPERAIKTFVFSFFSILIPELCIVLQSDFPVDMSFATTVFAPMFCSALAAGLSATWNFIENCWERSNSEIVDVDGETVDK